MSAAPAPSPARDPRHRAMLATFAMLNLRRFRLDAAILNIADEVARIGAAIVAACDEPDARKRADLLLVAAKCVARAQDVVDAALLTDDGQATTGDVAAIRRGIARLEDGLAAAVAGGRP
ncbi:MAG: hypothetical protein U0575_07375 [Phycisphaerales bacterium]